MASPTEILLVSSLVVALAAKMSLPVCRRIEIKREEDSRAAAAAVTRLRKNLKPGTYSFRWLNGRLQEPTFSPHISREDADKVLIRLLNGDASFDNVKQMPIAYQRQLLELINTGLDRRH